MASNEKDLNKDKQINDDMGYYCKLCQCWHNTGSEIWRAHRIYASQRPPKRELRKNFWERLGRW